MKTLVRTMVFSLLAAACVILSSCTPSLHPLFTYEEYLHEPALAGVWKNAERECTFILKWFRDGKQYHLQTELKDQPPAEFGAVLGEVGQHRFLQICPKRPRNVNPDTFFGGHFFQTYTFWKAELGEDSLILTGLDPRWIEEMAKAGKLDIPHEKQEGGFLVLTASTQELKEFVLKYAEDQTAFSVRLSFERAR